MNGHLPECPSSSPDPLAADCCCSRLRACERRVLDAAREAVERVSTLFEPLGPALAAIDALKEKP